MVGRGGKIVGSGPSVGIGGTGVLFGGLVGCPGVFVGSGIDVLVGLGVRDGFGVLVCRGSDVEGRSSLWQSGSALSIKRSPSSSLALKQYSLP